MYVRSLPQRLFVVSWLALAGCGEEASPAAARALFRTPTVATLGGTFSTPYDAAPSPDGATVYFVAQGGSRGAGLFRVAARGGDATEVHTGAPFVMPRGLAVSSDGQRVVVADGSAGVAGGLYVVPTAGGAPTLLAGTEGTAPRGLEIVAQGGGDFVYYTGTMGRGTPSVFRIPLTGGPLQVVTMGGMLRNPSSVAVTATGVVYVSDRYDDVRGIGGVYRIENFVVSTVVNDVHLGNPAGITLAPGDGVLGVSSHDAQGRCQVLLVDLSTGATSTYNQVISANRAAGGVHRAHGGTSTDLAWADLGGGLRGTVYRIQFN